VTVTAARADPVAADNGSPPDDSTRAARAGVRGLKAPQVAQHLRGMKGRVAVAILYGTHCPRSQAMFPGFVALSEAHQSDPVQFAAIETDRYPEDLRGFLGSFRAPFDPLFYVHRQRGELDAALREFGVNLPATFNMPYVAVLDPDGNVIDQWDAATNLAAIDGAIRQGLAR
jgi:thiol-disulfide isomerase/thioredoxin